MEIDWSTAEVRDGTLTVALEGEPSKDWSQYAAGVLDRLRRGSEPFGEVEFGKERIEVASVRAGAEADVRHLLESAVLQANAHFAAQDDDQDDADDATAEDRRMTEALRAFGEE